MATAVPAENVHLVERAAREGADLAAVLGVLTWHLTESAAFISLLHADGAGSGSAPPGYALAPSRRVERALRGQTKTTRSR
ncbi:hypothetical protein [Streptomyces sp. AC512_CC834]|uniref:hypothetical protein n=1 Tax=Streptomyces sp. AC512_CC834 TaxID=2823691 RepID=UPI001C275653